MEELIKALDIKKIVSLHMEYIDNNGDYKRIEMCNEYHVTINE